MFRCLNSNDRSKLEPKTALAIIVDNKIGREQFQEMKKIIKVTSKDIFPSWEKIKEFREKVTPVTINIMKSNVEGIIEYFTGIHYTYSLH